MNPQREMDDVLVEFGIHLGYEKNRERLAQGLIDHGLSLEDLRMLDVHFLEQAVEVAAQQRLAAVAFLEIPADAHGLVGQAEHGFTDAAALRVEASNLLVLNSHVTGDHAADD